MNTYEIIIHDTKTPPIQQYITNTIPVETITICANDGIILDNGALVFMDYNGNVIYAWASGQWFSFRKIDEDS